MLVFLICLRARDLRFNVINKFNPIGSLFKQGFDVTMAGNTNPKPIFGAIIIPMMPLQRTMTNFPAKATSVVKGIRRFINSSYISRILFSLDTGISPILSGIICKPLSIGMGVSQSFFSMAVIIIASIFIVFFSVSLNPRPYLGNDFLSVCLIVFASNHICIIADNQIKNKSFLLNRMNDLFNKEKSY